MAIRPLSQTLSVSQGKGTSDELADVSAAMEAIELWHSENAPSGDLNGSYVELREQGFPVCDPVTLRSPGVFPNALDLRSRRCDWLPAESLSSGRLCFVPRYVCAIGTDAAVPEYFVVNVNSTGLAGGNSLDEASCHALCEVIERDATARFEGLPPDEREAREIEPATVTGPARALLGRLETAGMCVRLWDQSSPIGVAAFGCTIEAVAELRGLARFAGFGAHLDPQIAVSRAISEAVQSRLTIISGARDDRPPSTYASMRQFVASPQLGPTPSRSFAAAPKCQTTGSFATDLRLLVQRVIEAGFSDAICVNLTRPELGIPVVFVLVPSAQVLLE